MSFFIFILKMKTLYLIRHQAGAIIKCWKLVIPAGIAGIQSTGM